MPFYLTNENIEATMERNPDDTFNPSEIEYSLSKQNSMIRQCISHEIISTFEKYTHTKLTSGVFESVSLIKEEKPLRYVLTFETNLDEYEIVYYIPQELASLLEESTHKIKEILLSVSSSMISALNEKELSFLSDIELIEFVSKPCENKNELRNVYALRLTIKQKEYQLYLQLDEQFNKIF